MRKLLLISLAWLSSHAAEAEPPAPLSLIVELTDGSRIVGKAEISTVPFIAEYGKVDLAMERVAAVTFREDRETAKVTMSNGDNLQGVLDIGDLKLRTLMGELSVPIRHVVQMIAGGGLPPDAFGPPRKLFEVPVDEKDQYGNPIRRGTDPKTGLPLEIRHKPTGMHFVLIPAGEFLMGSPEDEKDRNEKDGPQHRVRITKAFYLGKYEITQGEWSAQGVSYRSAFRGRNNPVDQVSWSACQTFIGKLNGLLPQHRKGLNFALPTEAQWEYACRAGTTTRCFFDNQADAGRLGDYAWYRENSGGRTHPVGGKRRNPWGLYDIYGNLHEWCSDREGWYLDADQVDTEGPGPDYGRLIRGRVIRGAAWNNRTPSVRSARRNGWPEGYRDFAIGVRVALRVPRMGPRREGAYRTPAIRDGLLLYYSFDEAGERAEDKSGKGNHGKVHQAKWTPNGKFGGAYEFDGKTTYIQRDFDERSEVFPRNTPFSIAAWFRTSASLPPEQTVLGSHFPGGGGGGYFLTLNINDLGGRNRWGVCSGRTGAEVQSKLPVNDGRWHHAVGTWNGEQALLYIDGVAQGSAKSPGLIPYIRRPPLRIGHLQNVPPARDGDYYFKGTIDEVMVFNRALSAKEVQLLSKSP